MKYKAYPMKKDTRRKARKGSRTEVFVYNNKLGKKTNENKK